MVGDDTIQILKMLFSFMNRTQTTAVNGNNTVSRPRSPVSNVARFCLSFLGFRSEKGRLADRPRVRGPKGQKAKHKKARRREDKVNMLTRNIKRVLTRSGFPEDGII